MMEQCPSIPRQVGETEQQTVCASICVAHSLFVVCSHFSHTLIILENIQEKHTINSNIV